MRVKEITPKGMRCVVGACPAVYETDCGTLIIIGQRLDSTTTKELFHGKISANEIAVEIPRGIIEGLPK